MKTFGPEELKKPKRDLCVVDIRNTIWEVIVFTPLKIKNELLHSTGVQNTSITSFPGYGVMMVSTAGRHYHVPRLVSVSQQQCFFFLNLFREKTERFIHQSEASVHPKAGLIIRSSYRIIPLVFQSSFYCNSAVNQMNGAADRRLNSINLPSNTRIGYILLSWNNSTADSSRNTNDRMSPN